MICVSIGRGRHQQMIAEHARLAEEGIKLVELRLDFIRREVNLKRLLAERPCPVIIACRREEDGGQWRGSEEHRVMLLRAAIVEGVDYVDLEEDLASLVPRFGRTKRIISHHDFRETPADLAGIHAQLAKMDPDIIKIATIAHCPSDSTRMLKLVAESKIPTVGFCMGEMGSASRILCGRYGSPFTYAAFSTDRTTAPGQIGYRQMAETYGYDRINLETEIFGVIADPVAHSLSPTVHNAAYRALDLPKVYLPFRVTREHLSEFLGQCRELGIRGLSVTIPHKEAMVSHCDRVDGAAKALGAVNTVVFEGNEILGFNTDYRAAMNCLDVRLNTESRKTPLAGHSALVLGAGGAARALAYGLKRRRADVVIASRTQGRAEKLAKEVDARAVSWDQRHQVQAEVIVNCTPVGMHPNVDETPFDSRYFRPKTIVFDTVYNPEQTLFFKQARERNCQVISGAEMFLGQAALQFKHFTDQDPPLAVMEESFHRSIGAAGSSGMIANQPHPSLFLIGARGTGKTTVGRSVAQRLQLPWCDSDLEIENRLGRSITDLFAKEGEEFFRDTEENVLKELIENGPAVLSLGGGAILRTKTQARIRAHGLCVWLQGTPEVLIARMQSDPRTASQRPSLTGKSPLEEVRELLEVRRPIYGRLAQFTVETDRRTMDEIVELIVTWWHAQTSPPKT